MRKKIAAYMVGFYVLIAIFHPFIANEKPLYCKINGASYLPILSNKSLKFEDASFKIMPPIPFSYNSLDKEASFLAPFQSRHWLGTDIIGRDTVAGLLKGTEIAVKIGFLSVFLASILALVIGLIVSYTKRFPIRVNLIAGILAVVSLIILAFYFWIGLYSSMTIFFIVLVILLLVNGGYQYLVRHQKKKWIIPIDGFYLRVIEVMKAIPTLIILLASLSIFHHFSVNGLILLLAFLLWPGLSRYVRADALKILSQDYIVAARAYGASNFRILWKHVLPKLFTSLTVVATFAISSAILIESTLSFLGLGIPIEQVSWGSMLKEAQMNFSAWWLAVFPGLALFGLILSLNILGEEDS